MKKYITVIILACLFGINAQAQMAVKPGIRAGANFSNFTDTDFKYRTDFYVGGFVSLKLTRYYTLQPEINYSAQGAKTRHPYVIGNNISDDIKIDYLSFALLNKITFNDQFNLVAGPTFDVVTGSHMRNNSNIDMAITGGLGYMLPIGITIEGRAKLGIIDVLESDNFNNSGNYVGGWNCNYVFQLGLSYSFDAKGATK